MNRDFFRSADRWQRASPVNEASHRVTHVALLAIVNLLAAHANRGLTHGFTFSNWNVIGF